VYPSTITLLRRLKTAGVATALVTASRNSAAVLAEAGVTEVPRHCRRRRRGRPAPRGPPPCLDIIQPSIRSRPGRHAGRHHPGRGPPWRYGGDGRPGPAMLLRPGNPRRRVVAAPCTAARAISGPVQHYLPRPAGEGGTDPSTGPITAADVRRSTCASKDNEPHCILAKCSKRRCAGTLSVLITQAANKRPCQTSHTTNPASTRGAATASSGGVPHQRKNKGTHAWRCGDSKNGCCPAGRGRC
jgi:hypothetical protein